MIPQWVGEQKIDNGRIVQTTQKAVLVAIDPDCAENRMRVPRVPVKIHAQRPEQNRLSLEPHCFFQSG